MARLLKEADVSTMIGLSVHWLRRKRRAGTGIPYIKVAEGRGGAVRYRDEDVDTFLVARVRATTPEATATRVDTNRKPMFFEVLDFLRSSGGAYENMQEHQLFRIWECLKNGLYFCQRNRDGHIVQFLAYWRVNEAELPKAQRFLRPPNPTKGTVLFVVDFASKLPAAATLYLVHTLIAEREPDATLLCCMHKGRFVVCERTGTETRPWKLRS